MKRRQLIFLIILIIILAVSMVFSVQTIIELSTVEDFGYIPIVLFIISLAVLISNLFSIRNTKETRVLNRRLKMWNSITYKVKKAGETAFNKLPIGIVVIDDDTKIVWSNQTAKTIFMSPLEQETPFYLKNLSSNVYDKLETGLADLSEETVQEMITFNADIYGKIYYVEYLINHNVMYLTDITNFEHLQTLYHNRIEVLGYINIDNLEEALQEFDVQTKAEYEGRIIGAIAKWATENGVFIRGLTSTRYILVTDQEHLDKLMKNNFSILDDIKVLFNTTRVIRVTLSMGIACKDINVNDLSEEAEDQLELALNRGGDQVVVKKNNEVFYFGAKTDPIVKESKVEMRVMCEELSNLISNSSKVFVVAHANIDADGFGATLAMYKWAKHLGKEAYIILRRDSMDDTVKRIIHTIDTEYQALNEAFIHPNRISSLVDKESLLMIVDFQHIYQAQAVDKKMLDRFDKIAIIDHHRKGNNAIDNHKFYYSKTSASSSVELIVELMSFLNEPVFFNELEATWLLLGIVVDTNNFVYRALAATFEVASILQRFGADMKVVKKYLKEDLNDKRLRQNAFQNVEIYLDRVAIARLDENMIVDRAMLAKISDDLISVNDVDLAITVGMIEDKVVGLSARSLLKENAQRIMEEMGGGGHFNSAAAQRRSETIEQTITILKDKLNDVIVAEEIMKIILIKDLKGKGKKGDVIEVAAGYGNNLVRNEMAILASPENLKALEDEKNQQAIREEEELQRMKELKEKIEKTEVKIAVKVGKEGKLFGSVSSKQIADAMEKELKEKIDKRKINLDSPLTTLGAFEIKIDLHKDVVAKIKVFVIEEK